MGFKRFSDSKACFSQIPLPSGEGFARNIPQFGQLCWPGAIALSVMHVGTRDYASVSLFRFPPKIA